MRHVTANIVIPEVVFSIPEIPLRNPKIAGRELRWMSMQRRGTPAEGDLLLEALKAESLSSISLALDTLHAWIDIPARRYPIRIMYQENIICRYRDHMAVYLGSVDTLL